MFTFLDLPDLFNKIELVSSEFDWFMVTMPIFALVVYAIVMVGSMEKQPKFLDSSSSKKILGLIFIALFGAGIIISGFYMILRFFELLGNY